MARSWGPGRSQSPRCRRWVEAASPPARKPPSSEALQTTAFSGRRVLTRENWWETTRHAAAPSPTGTRSGHCTDTHDAGVEPSPHQLVHQLRGQRRVGPEEP